MKNKAGNKKKLFESIVHGIFLILGLITVGCVLLITVYLIISGIPAIKKIGLIPFLFGKRGPPHHPSRRSAYCRLF